MTEPETSNGSVSSKLDGIYTGSGTEITTPGEGGEDQGVGENDKQGNLTIDLKVGATEGAPAPDKAALTVTKQAASTLNNANSLTVTADAGTVKLDASALDKMSKSATGEVVISIAKGTGTDAGKYTFTATSDNKNLFPEDESNGFITVSVPAPTGVSDTVYVYYLGPNGAEKITNAEVVGGNVVWSVSHFSTYLVTAEEQKVSVTDADGNTKTYDTLEEAISKAGDSATVKLLQDYDPDDNVLTIEGKKALTLDLGGNTLTLQLDVKNSHLTLQNGSITAPTKTATLSGGAAVYVYGSGDSSAKKDSCVVNVESSARLSGYYGILVSGPTYGSNVSYGVTVNVKGTVNDPLFISGNLNDASARKDENATTINILDGAKMNNTICMNGEAVVNVDNGATVTGDDAIAVKRGQLNITGGTFTATGAKVNPAEANTNGSETTGSAISVTSTYNTSVSEIDINISGGTFSSVNNAAVYLGHAKNTSGESLGYRGSLDLEISGGHFSGGSDVPSIYVAEKISADTGISTEEGEKIAEKFISGGTYTNEVQEYLADGIQYEVGHTDGSFTYTKTMEEAQEAAKPGDVITALATGEAENPTIYYMITLNNESSVYATKFVESGKTYQLPAAPSGASNQRFDGWKYQGTLYQPGYTFTIRGSMTFDAIWSTISTGGSSGVTRYNVTVEDTDNGSIRVSPSRASRGQTVTITVDPDEGYVLDRLIVRDSDGDRIDVEQKSSTRYTFEMPRGAVTIEATFVEGEEENVLPFRDVDVDDWFYDAVVYAYENDLMSGVSAREFAPNSTLTRAMVAQMLWAMEGKPQVNYLMQYADVGSGDWYAEAVRWASSQGIMSGYGDSQFGPNDPVTRQQLALILYNYAKEKDYDTTGGGMALREYSDYDAIADWAVTGLGWAVEHGLISGMGDGVLAPTGGATRAQVAQIFMNFCEDVAE